MSLDTFLATLEPYNPSSPVIFRTDDYEIGGGYHVTELRHSEVTGIDCSGHLSRWRDARVQLLDAPGDNPMTIGTLRGILAKSIAQLPELATVPFAVEFGPKNRDLRVMSVDEPKSDGDHVVIHLRDTSALCKPLERIRATYHPSAESGGAATSRCCA